MFFLEYAIPPPPFIGGCICIPAQMRAKGFSLFVVFHEENLSSVV